MVINPIYSLTCKCGETHEIPTPHIDFDSEVYDEICDRYTRYTEGLDLCAVDYICVLAAVEMNTHLDVLKTLHDVVHDFRLLTKSLSSEHIETLDEIKMALNSGIDLLMYGLEGRKS